MKNSHLRGNEIPVHLCDQSSLAFIAEVSNQADEFSVGGGESSDIVRLVVCVCARESLATGDRLCLSHWEDLLDTLGIIWVDDGGDVEEV